MNPAHSQTLATASFTNSLDDNNSLSSAIFLTRSITHCLFIIYYDIFNAKLDKFTTEDN